MFVEPSHRNGQACSLVTHSSSCIKLRLSICLHQPVSCTNTPYPPPAGPHTKFTLGCSLSCPVIPHPMLNVSLRKRSTMNITAAAIAAISIGSARIAASRIAQKAEYEFRVDCPFKNKSPVTCPGYIPILTLSYNPPQSTDDNRPTEGSGNKDHRTGISSSGSESSRVDNHQDLRNKIGVIEIIFPRRVSTISLFIDSIERGWGRNMII